jgi:hypothetical protein
MSDTTTETTDDGTGAGLEGMTGSLDTILEALGLEAETPEERAEVAATGKVGVKPALEAKGEADEGGEKPEEKDAKADDDEAKAKDEKKPDAVDEEIEALRAIRAKSRARHQAAQAPAAVPAVAAKPAESAPAKVAVAEAIAKPTPGESEVAAAVRDVVAQIAKLTADEEAAVASNAKDTGADERAKTLKTIQDQIGKLAEKVGGSDALTAKFGELQQQLKDAADQRFVEQRIDAAIAKIETKVPLLSARRNAVAMVQEAAEAFYKKNGKLAPLEFVAERVERVLARREQQSKGESPASELAKAGEKKSPSRKTVSTDHATPPSARTGPDKRTPKEVEQDLWKSLGIDPEM